MARSRSAGARVDLGQHAVRVARALERSYPEALCALEHQNPFELLVATILSAQCTDRRVNLVTPALFRRFPTPEKLARSEPSELEEIIKSTGFFRAKARNLRAMAQALVQEFNAQLPQSIEQLTRLPGVGRKTANVVLGTAFGKASGVVVDTHVKRITRLLGLTRQTDPQKIEAELMKLLPAEEWVNFSHRLIHHGRRICIARRPNCTACPLLPLCPRVGLKPLTVGPTTKVAARQHVEADNKPKDSKTGRAPLR